MMSKLRPSGRRSLSLAERTEKFWNWFGDNEEKISRMFPFKTQCEADKLISLVSSGTKLISENIYYNLGGDHEFIFSIEDWPDLFVIYPYIISCMPERLKSEWNFLPCNPGTDDPFVFRMNNVEIETAEIMIRATYSEENRVFDITYFARDLDTLSELQSNGTMLVILEQTLGDRLSYIYVGAITRSEKFEEGMIQLPGLRKHIKEVLAARGNELCEDPRLNFGVYHMEPKESKEPRFDIVTGYTSLDSILAGYYNGSTKLVDHIRSFGAKAVYLAYNNPDNLNLSDLTKFRNEIEDKITCEIIEPLNNAQLIGAATGLINSYVDFIVYDYDSFVSALRDFMKQYPHLSSYLAEFKMHAHKTIIS
ncbi:MAG: hypothetical protein K2G29_02685 [Muribaculaceae bacterium]|nr:hypothetical protein [Muribaculaceae bacterium]